LSKEPGHHQHEHYYAFDQQVPVRDLVLCKNKNVLCPEFISD
jgi:hypothetical protein